MADIQARVLYDNYGEQKALEGANLSLSFDGFIGTHSDTQYTDEGGYVHFESYCHLGDFTVYVKGQDFGTYRCDDDVADVTVEYEF